MRLERLSYAQVRRRAIAGDAAAVASPRGAGGQRERKKVPRDDVGGELGADRGLERVGAKRARPNLAGVDEERAVNRLQKQRPRAVTALGSYDRKSVIGVHDRGAAAGKCVDRKTAE